MDLISKQSLPASLGNLAALMETVSASARQKGIDEKRISEIELALEEALVNIINYSYPSEKGDVQIACLLNNENRFVIEISDYGAAFNILSVDDPDIESGITERKVGGLGIFLIKKLMNNVEYKRENGRNILTLTT